MKKKNTLNNDNINLIQRALCDFAEAKLNEIIYGDDDECDDDNFEELSLIKETKNKLTEMFNEEN